MEKWGEKVKTLFSLGTRESGFEGCEKSKLYFCLTENKIRGYKTVEINGFYDLKDLKRRFSIKIIPCGNILIVKIVGVCRQDRY